MTAGESDAVVSHILAEIRFLFLRQTCNFLPEAGAGECFAAAGAVRLFQCGTAHVLCNEERESKWFLKDRRNRFVILRRIQVRKRETVDGNLSFCRLIQSADQLNNRGFSSAVDADECGVFTSMECETDRSSLQRT